MKKTFSILLVLAVVLAFAAPIAGAEGNKLGKGIGVTFCKALCLPFTPLIGIGEAIKDGKISKVALIPDAFRKNTFDVVESTGRTLIVAEPLGVEDRGAVNTVITDAKLDWLADAAFYGAISGVAFYNHGVAHGAHHIVGPVLVEQTATLTAAVAVGTAAATAGGQALDEAGK